VSKDPRQPIIIKRVKKGHHGHHGGAWKIAYADFVTAMMAFFLLMWLLGSTTKGDLQGISEYFRTPLKVALTGGSGAGQTANVIQGGSVGFMQTNSEMKAGSPFPKASATDIDGKDARKKARADEAAKLAELLKRFEETLEQNPAMSPFRKQVRLDLTTEGLRIQIVDEQNRPMFDSGSSHVKDYMREILREMGKVLNTVDYRVTLSGHTDAKQYASGDRGYSNWELSADRANASRRELIAGGMAENKIVRVVGAGASANLNKADPNDPINRRISIIVMNKDTERRVFRELGESGNDPTANDAEDLAEKIPGASAPRAGGDNGSAAAVTAAEKTPTATGKREQQ
jgi:chemotaxis protein MotB